jgi:hypothetical protein
MLETCVANRVIAIIDGAFPAPFGKGFVTAPID